MSEKVVQGESLKEFNRNKWFFSIGGIGRDLAYQLVATFYIIYIQFVVGLNTEQFLAIGAILVAMRVFDALNDPIMGAIIEGSKMKWGKFKPWIFLGAVLSGVVIVLMFNSGLKGNEFVWFFAAMSFLWSIVFTINDVGYWSMLPSLSTDSKRRDSAATLTVVFATIGAVAANLVVMFFTVGDGAKTYPVIAIGTAVFLIACQSLTAFGVKESKIITSQKAAKVSIKGMIKTIFSNDQLLWMVLVVFAYNIGSGLLVALGYNFLYITFGYDGLYGTIFVGIYAVMSIISQGFYPVLAKKFKRSFLITWSVLVTLIGYGLIAIFGQNLFVLYACGAVVFAGQGVFYMTIILGLTNCIEYNEYKKGERKEAIIFSLRSLMAKLCSALQQAIVVLLLALTGIVALTNSVSTLESQKKYFDTFENSSLQQQYISVINNYRGTESAFTEADRAWLDSQGIILEIDSVKPILDAYICVVGSNNTFKNIGKVSDMPTLEADKTYALVITTFTEDGKQYLGAVDANYREKASDGQVLWLQMGISVIPAVLVGIAGLVMRKKYIIDEEYYQMMLESINSRKID